MGRRTGNLAPMSDEDRVCCRMRSGTSLLLEIPFEVQNGAVSTER
jgi:hypothetical protein